jgi:purine-nucleoside phosphorylase
MTPEVDPLADPSIDPFAEPLADPFAVAQAAAGQLAEKTGLDHHDVAVVLGSGWLPAADRLGQVKVEASVRDLVGFATPSVAGHAGTVRSIATGSARVLAFVGRVHLYEGYRPTRVVHAIRTAVFTGCRIVVLTSAAGGVNDGFHVGQPVLLSDHINLTGQSPLSGPAPPEPYASRFVDMTAAYSPLLRAVAREVDPSLAEGVYAAFPGPQYETPAEVGMARAMGADLVGMSTALETIAARHLGAEVLGCSLVTNVAAGLGPAPATIDHHEVLKAGARAAASMGEVLAELIRRL